MAAVAFPPGLALSIPERLPVLLNCVSAGSRGRRRSWQRYLTVELRTTLHGEEVRTAQLSVTIRLSDGARTEPFRVSCANEVSGKPLGDEERRIVTATLRSWLHREVPSLHYMALEALQQRGHRDLERMADYYASLDSEMARAAERTRSEAERKRRLAKWSALAADLESRREQLRVRMRPRLGARILGATLVECDVDEYDMPVRRRKREGTIVLTCRTTDGVIEGPACASCGVATLRLWLCDERLHVLCESCGQSGVLDAARCRACGDVQPERPVVRLEDPTAQLALGGAILSS
jgi:hypothetical protein